MGIPDFMQEFKVLHDKLKNGTLTPSERLRYEVARSQFGRIALVAQQLGHTGQTLRATLRMAKMLKVELRPDGGEPMKTSTIDLASGGFATLLPTGMRHGIGAGFTLYLPAAGGGTAPITGRVAVASSRSQTSLFRVSFRFEPLDAKSKDMLEIAIIDAVLERFAKA